MRNKKLKNEYHKKRQLLLSHDLYKAKNKKLPVSKVEYQELKDEILILESRYPSIKKIGDDLVIRATLNYPDGRTYQGAIKSAEQQIPHGDGFMYLKNDKLDWDYVGEFKDGVFDGEGEKPIFSSLFLTGDWGSDRPAATRFFISSNLFVSNYICYSFFMAIIYICFRSACHISLSF